MKAASWVMAGLAVLAAVPATAAPIRVQARVPAALLVIIPPGQSPAASTAALLSAADEALTRHTRLEVRSLEQFGVDPQSLHACRSALRLSCWARTLGEQTSGTPPRFALVLALLPLADGREQASVHLLDLEFAATVLAHASPDAPEAAAAAEDELFERTPRSRSVRLDLTDPEARRDYFTGIVQDDFQSAFEAAGVLGALGAVDVQGTRAGWPIFVDEAEVGLTSEGRTEVAGVPVGPRRVRVRAPWGEDVQQELTVPPVGSAVMVVGPPPAGVHPGRTVVRWGGLAVAAAGVAVFAAGAAKSSDGSKVTCLRRAQDTGDCAGLGTATTGYNPDAAPSTDPARVDAGGLAIVPLGLALGVAGASASAAAWTLPEDADFPWWALVIGAAAGALTYGVGHAVGR